ncbi:oxygen-independent coproporphyrinogen III oxidase [Flavisphingomonas formosensis]|uniref:oxygen-independent coproporphyrinogen III oxidase n=1 Tax=Flavisphingomonas formosensis TaxID=861534 RepID=UPI0012F89583|nr:oxygen-independent coproporphyrinogen III oxidase [Sphingomonas formosensis]
MWPYRPDLLARAVPRYTSYPTAAEFHGGIGEADMRQAIAAIPAGERVSLYVHIPYCREICWYCGCNTGAANRSGRLAAYLDALDREINLVGALLPAGVETVRIAFGGGSPNALSPLQFARLVDRLVTRFRAAGATLSIELDPRTLDAAWIDTIGAIGIAQASLGVQSFAAHVQRAIGRVQPPELIAHATAALRAAGVRSLNFDLMYGLPDQSAADFDETLEQAEALAPDRLAIFGYAHLPALLPRQRRIDGAALPDGEARFRQAWRAWDRLTAAGYRPIGFDHFARPGDPLAIAASARQLRRNFQGFTEDQCETVIGLGASAISRFPGLLAQNEKLAGRYRMRVSAGRLATQRGTARSADDRRRGAAIERLLCIGSARIDDDLIEPAWAMLRPYAEAGLVLREGNRLIVPQEGLPYARSIASGLDAYRNQSSGTFSRAV